MISKIVQSWKVTDARVVDAMASCSVILVCAQLKAKLSPIV